MGLNVADMLFCLLLDMSVVISTVYKLFERVPSEQLRLIRKAEDLVMKSRMTLTSKCQLVLHFLLFTLTVPLIGVHDRGEAPGIFELYLFLIQLVTIGRKLKRLKMPHGFFVEKMEAHYWETV